VTTAIRLPQPNSPEWIASMDPGGVFEQWHDVCREWVADQVPADHSEFAGGGFEKMPFLETAEASTVKAHIEEASMVAGNVKPTGEYQDTVREESSEYLFGLLGKILNDDVSDRIRSYFQSEFFVHWFQFARAYPHPNPSDSFLWHRDGGPKAFVNIMIYLNPTEEHGGNTHFLDIETTAKLARVGYEFPNVEERLGDLTELAAKAGAKYEPFISTINAGEGLIFKAREVLHRGVLPTMGPRYVMFINLMPSFRPWRDGFERWPMNFMEIVAGNWTTDYIQALAGDDGPTVIS